MSFFSACAAQGTDSLGRSTPQARPVSITRGHGSGLGRRSVSFHAALAAARSAVSWAEACESPSNRAPLQGSRRRTPRSSRRIRTGWRRKRGAGDSSTDAISYHARSRRCPPARWSSPWSWRRRFSADSGSRRDQRRTGFEAVSDTNQTRKPSCESGSVRTRWPEALKIALATAGASGGSAGSPSPVGEKSLSTKCTSISGACGIRSSA